MLGDQKKNIMIGLFVASAIFLIVFILLFLRPSIGDKGQTIYVRFSNIDKVSVGTRVTFAGKPIGEVEQIQPIESAADRQASIGGKVYAFLLTLSVDSKVKIYTTDDFSIRTSGLLGEKSVAITPQPQKEGFPLQLITKNIIINADESGTVEETLKEFKDLSDKLEEALNVAITSIDDLQKEKVWAKIAKATEEIGNVFNSFDNPEEIKNTLSNISSISSKVNNLFINIEEGKGDFGKFFKEDELYLKTSAILGKAEVLADDINHYGLLFHLDKGWQRTRAKRANLLYTLQTPDQFKHYFNEEISDIETALCRVEKAMQEANQKGIAPCLNNKPFVSVFSDLLRRIKQMEESISLYNQQLIDEGSYGTPSLRCY